MSITCGIAVFSDRIEAMLASYHNHTSLMSELESLVESYPHLARIYSLGNSTQNRELAVIQITEGVTEVNIYFVNHIDLSFFVTSNKSKIKICKNVAIQG